MKITKIILSIFFHVMIFKLSYLEFKANTIFNIELLENINFGVLKELHLSTCGISDITMLEKVKLEKLEKLYL